MRLIVIDPRFKARHGHHYSVNAALVREWRRRGGEVEIHGRADADQDVVEALGVRPTFRNGAYARFGRDDSEYRIFRAADVSESVAKDLARHVRAAGGDVLLVHTIHAYDLTGLYSWFAALSAPRPRMVVMFRFPPSFGLRPEETHMARGIYAYVLGLFKNHADGDAAFGADSAVLARHIQRLAPMPISVMPMPIVPDDLPGRPTGADDRFHLTYLGDARPEKGFLLLVPALRQVFSDAGVDLRVTIQGLTAGSDTWDRFAAEFAAISPQIRLTGATLDVGAYHRLLASSDAVLVAYDPVLYYHRTSHVFVEALAHGKPLVVAARSWMDIEAANLEAAAGGELAVRMARFDARSLAAAILDLVANRQRLTEVAERIAPAWRSRHTAAAYVDRMLAMLGPDASPPRGPS
ncbi:MAG: glycosyltransferase family 4 protein [Alphaproteobacteria bacterium]|nr:glycosyltransferase family 4 protein [Alphaproteobacteria bacterium]